LVSIQASLEKHLKTIDTPPNEQMTLLSERLNVLGANI
jgi:hypothetical protein